MFSASIYWGAGVGGLGNFIIDFAGWRTAYLACGAFGIFIGALSLVMLKEPERGKFDFLTCDEPMGFDDVNFDPLQFG